MMTHKYTFQFCRLIVRKQLNSGIAVVVIVVVLLLLSSSSSSLSSPPKQSMPKLLTSTIQSHEP